MCVIFHSNKIETATEDIDIDIVKVFLVEDERIYPPLYRMDDSFVLLKYV